MPSYVFPGFPRFLELAAAELGLPQSARPAGRITALTDLANLCAQAAHGDPEHVAEILAKATDFRDQIATALRAAELMLADVEAAQRAETLRELEPEQVSDLPQIHRPARKAPRNERVPS